MWQFFRGIRFSFQVNEIFNCPMPEGNCAGDPGEVIPLPTTPSNPTPVSCYLGDRTKGATPGATPGAPYPILFPLGTGPGLLPIQSTTLPGDTFGTDDGLAYPTKIAQALCSTAPCTAFNTALSIFDFNQFRSAVISSIDILDQKIRDIVDISAANCP